MHVISRRRLLRRALSATAALGAAIFSHRQWSLPRSVAEGATYRVRLPFVAQRFSPSIGSRVVHVHDADATSWNYGASYYGDYVDQDVVNIMLDRAVCTLTGTATAAAAWQALIPGYTAGKGIAVKVNFNNWYWCDATAYPTCIDGLIQPINAAIRGLSAAFADFDPADVWIYDATVYDDNTSATRRIPQRFQDGCLYSGVRFFDGGGDCNELVTFDSVDATADITWRNPSGVATPPARQVPDVLVNASYLINVPIMKKHVSGGVTLGFKNHAGSVKRFIDLHDWIDIYSGAQYSAAYNPLVDIYRNAHIGPKTVLTIGDGLYGNWESNMTVSQPWKTFGDAAANSLFVATDPVAVDCVMADFLDAESRAQGNGALLAAADDYLVLAAEAELGTYERGDPWGAGYSAIDYRHIAL